MVKNYVIPSARKGKEKEESSSIPKALDNDIKRAQREARFKAPVASQEYGLISRGDDRLQKSRTAREKFLKQIEDQYASYCHNSKDYFLRTSLAYVLPTTTPSNCLSDNVNPDKILLSLRKLRESIVSLPIDSFTSKCFLFSMRVSVCFSKYESFIPSATFLLEKVHKVMPLTQEQFDQVIRLYICNLAVKKEFSHAYDVLEKYSVEDNWCWGFLRVMVSENYARWTKLLISTDDIILQHFLKVNQSSMLVDAIKAISKSYFSLDTIYLERILDASVTELTNKHGCTWKLDEGGNKLIIRQRASKK